MSNLFFNAALFNQPLSTWDVSHVTNIGHIVQGALDFNQDIGAWDVSSVTNMAYTFYNAPKFNQDISGWDVSKVTNMVRILERASSFDQNLGKWDIRSVAKANNGGGSLVNAFNNAGISCSNYSQTLKGWAENPNAPTGLTFGATGLSYDQDFAAAYHDDLVNNRGWIISGDAVGHCTVNETPLPVTLIDFSGTLSKGKALLHWQTGVENNVDHFELEAIYNADGKDPKGSFVSLGRLKAKGDGSTYQLPVAQTADNAYYRLKIVDQDGSVTYGHHLVYLNQKLESLFRLYPNPATNHIKVLVNKACTLAIYATSGVLVRKVMLQKGINLVSISGLNSGIYFARANGAQIKLVIQ
jgi:surface protein